MKKHANFGEVKLTTWKNRVNNISRTLPSSHFNSRSTKLDILLHTPLISFEVLKFYSFGIYKYININQFTIFPKFSYNVTF